MKRVIFYLNGTDLKTICVNQIRMILTIDQPWEMPQVFLMNAERDRPTHIEFFSERIFPPVELILFDYQEFSVYK